MFTAFFETRCTICFFSTKCCVFNNVIFICL